MLAYLLLILIPVLYMFILMGLRTTYGLIEVPYKQSILKVFFFCFFLLLMFRAPTVGVDTPNYLRKLEVSPSFTWIQSVTESDSEPGFSLLVKLISVFTQNHQIYLGVIAAIILFPIAYFYSRESVDPLFTMLIFLILPLFGMIFSGLRQSISMALVIPAYYQIKKHHVFKFFLIISLAMTFHISAFICFLLYPVYYFKLTRKKLFFIIPLILLTYFFRDTVFSFLLQILSYIYVDHEWEILESGAWSMLALFAILMVFSYVFIDEAEAEEDLLGMRNFLVLSVVIQCFASIHALAMRMNYYFLIFLPILLPKIISKAKGKNAFACWVAEVVLCSYFMYYFLDLGLRQKSGFGIFPYAPFWQV